MEKTLRKVKVRRFAQPLRNDNFLKKGWLKRLGGRIGQAVGTITGREGIANVGTRLLEKGRAERAAVDARKSGQGSGTIGTMDMTIDLPAKVGAPSGVSERIKNIAGNMPSSDVNRGENILKTGRGILTEAQKLFAKGQTDPSRLPKTQALKEAEQKLLLPQKFSGAASVADSIKGIPQKYLIIGGIVLAIGLVTFFMLRK